MIPELPDASMPAETFSDRLLTGIGTAVDASIVRAMQIVVERALIPDEDDVARLLRSAQPLLDPELLSAPERFFDFGEGKAAPRVVSTREIRRLRGGAAMSRRLATEYTPFLSALDDDDPAPLSNGDPILLEHWVHERVPARGTVVALHGFAMGRPRFDAIALFASRWYERGLDVVLMTLPHHGARTGPTARFSGERFAVPHVARLSEAVRESIYEVLEVTRWLRESSDAPVGLLGLSLGGYLTALAAGLSQFDLDFAIPMVPPVCIGDLAWRFFRNTAHARRGGASALSQLELRTSFRVHSPLAHPLRMPRERVMIIAGRGDRIVPPEHPAALSQHWGEPRVHWFSGSHLAPFGRARIVEAVAGHLESLGIL